MKKSRALTTSEAVTKLLELGFENHRVNRISDNEFTEPFGATYTNPHPVIDRWYNPFTKQEEDIVDDSANVFYSLAISEYADGKSYLYIHRFHGKSGKVIFDYSKADAATKKRFMEVMEKESKK